MQGTTELESFANPRRPGGYHDWRSSYVGGKWKERKLDRHIWARTLRTLQYIAEGPALHRGLGSHWRTSGFGIK